MNLIFSPRCVTHTANREDFAWRSCATVRFPTHGDDDTTRCAVIEGRLSELEGVGRVHRRAAGAPWGPGLAWGAHHRAGPPARGGVPQGGRCRRSAGAEKARTGPSTHYESRDWSLPASAPLRVAAAFAPLAIRI